MNFHETIYGHRFFEAQLPNLIKAMERIADGLAHLEAGSPQSTTPTSSFLHDLYYGDYEPSVFKKQSSEQKKMDKSVSAAEAVLRNILQKSPSAIKAFEAYQIAVGEQHGAVTEQAFESGFQTAFQMLLAGLPLPEGTHDDEFPLTLQELRKMNGQRVFCLETNEEVQVVAYKKGVIRVTNDKENLPFLNEWPNAPRDARPLNLSHAAAGSACGCMTSVFSIKSANNTSASRRPARCPV